MGVMIESHLVAGRQDVVEGRPLVYGQSITDACIGWDDTVEMLEEARRGGRGAPFEPKVAPRFPPGRARCNAGRSPNRAGYQSASCSVGMAEVLEHDRDAVVDAVDGASIAGHQRFGDRGVHHRAVHMLDAAPRRWPG